MLSIKDFRTKDTYGLKVKRWKKIFHVNNNQKRTRVAILISDKINCKSKTYMRQRRTFYNYKRFNSTRIYNNNKHICTKH